MTLLTLMFSALGLTSLIGYQVNWSAEPARGQENGSVHVSVLFEEGDLLFVREDGETRAFWEIAVAIDDEYSTRNSGEVTSLPFTETLSIEEVLPGEHKLTVTISDLETGGVLQREETVVVPYLDSDSWSSGQLQIGGGPYQRASGAVDLVWNVYPPQNSEVDIDLLRTAYVVRDENGVTEREGWMETTGFDDYFKSVAEIDIGGLDAGRYEVLSAVIRQEDIITASKTDLQLLQNWDVWGEDPDLTETLIRPIAHSSELNELEDAQGPSSRRAVMAEFWEERDPTPGTVKNEYLELYLARLDYIEEAFTALNTMGINTDQGRVYALLGEPDIIQSRPNEMSTYPTEVWTYVYPPIEVSFIDYDGCGIYELATDWEEVQDTHERH
ncbi:MAG: GWxTD domain-containing protein [Candidatus Aegiribacteria sp.]|nr:GWxTD domain-containing protein [Candidatus Aegiribacteria sp.]